ncbi:MAG: CAP domain-containing protein [Chloroflexota bacterium]
MRRALAIMLLVVSSLLSPVVSQAALAAALPPSHDQYVARVLELVNVERQKVGSAPLVTNSALTYAAQTYAAVMSDTSCFSHTCGSTLVQRIDGSGYTNWTAAAENIALGQPTPEAVMTAWMNSTGHRTNILNNVYKEIGIGLALWPNGQLVWVQTFGASTNPIATPPPPPPPADCSVRPTFTVRSRRSAAGVLEVTVTAGTTSGAPNNRLQSIRFASVSNGTIDLTGYGRVSPGSTVSMAPNTQQAVFLVQRPTPGVATTVQLVLTDACGNWSTFVGAGPNAL